MNCLENYIGLRGSCSDSATPESGLYINDLPSISLKAMTSFANEEQENYIGFYDEIQTFSINQLRSDVLVKKAKYFDKQTLLSAQNSGKYTTPYVSNISSANLKGVFVELYDSYYSALKLNHVQLYLNSAIDGDIYIYDVNNGELIDTISFSGVKGSNIINLSNKIHSYGQRLRVFVCYDASLVDSIETVNYEHFPSYVISRHGKISKADSVSYNNINFDNNSSGLILNFNVTCEIDGLICQNRDYFKMPLFYLLGRNIMLSQIHNIRYNKYTMLNREELKELYDFYSDNYESSLVAALDSIEMTTDGICFSCNKQRTFKHLKP